MRITSRSCARFSSTFRTKLKAMKKATRLCLAAISSSRLWLKRARSAGASGSRRRKAAGTTSEPARPCRAGKTRLKRRSEPRLSSSILPLGPSRSWADGPLTLRLFPLKERCSQLEIYDDDGESLVDHANPPCVIRVSANWRDGVPSLQVSKQGDCARSWAKIHFEDAGREPMGVFINGTTCAGLATNTILSANGEDSS